MLGVSPIDTGEGTNHLAFHVILKKLLLKNFDVDCGICLLLVSAELGTCISRSQLSRPRLSRNTPLHFRANTVYRYTVDTRTYQDQYATIRSQGWISEHYMVRVLLKHFTRQNRFKEIMRLARENQHNVAFFLFFFFFLEAYKRTQQTECNVIIPAIVPQALRR